MSMLYITTSSPKKLCQFKYSFKDKKMGAYFIVDICGLTVANIIQDGHS
jgi:hypothetical protein